MPEYIDRDKLLEDIEHSVILTVGKSELAYGESRGAIKVINRIEAAPSANVVEVVRCKDCKHLTDDGLCWQNIHSVVGYKIPKPNDYCSYGKRKDGEENET